MIESRFEIFHSCGGERFRSHACAAIRRVSRWIAQSLTFGLVAFAVRVRVDAGAAEPSPGRPTEMIHVHPHPYEGALRNPLMGLTGRELEFSGWESLTHHYIGWREIEATASDGVDKIRAYGDKSWSGLAEHNVKVIPRVYLEYPGRPDSWPDGLEPGVYSGPEFERRLRGFVAKLGQAWDQDPRVAFVELGVFGKWGEHHSPAPSPEIQRIAGEAFVRAFPHKLVSVRQVWAEFSGFGFGEYWDSFAHWDQMANDGRSIAAANEGTGLFAHNYIGGEVAYDWGNWRIQPGESPTRSLADPSHLAFVINTVRWLHCTQLRWIGDYDRNNREATAGAIELQKALGYRFVLDEAGFTGTVGSDRKLRVAFRVRNVGSAPFYYRWPLAAYLLDFHDHHVVWRQTFADVDIRDWQPGRAWTAPSVGTAGEKDAGGPEPAAGDPSGKVGWACPPASHRVEGQFEPDVPSGKYLLALSILDPAGMVPAVCFATEQYMNGGFHPVGIVGFGGFAGGPLPADFRFDQQSSDGTLHYVADRNEKLDRVPNSSVGSENPRASADGAGADNRTVSNRSNQNPRREIMYRLPQFAKHLGVEEQEAGHATCGATAVDQRVEADLPAVAASQRSP